MCVCMYICCCENICSQRDDLENAFEFLNENSVADIFCFFSNNPTLNVVCSCFWLRLLSFKEGGLNDSE